MRFSKCLGKGYEHGLRVLAHPAFVPAVSHILSEDKNHPAPEERKRVSGCIGLAFKKLTMGIQKTPHHFQSKLIYTKSLLVN